MIKISIIYNLIPEQETNINLKVTAPQRVQTDFIAEIQVVGTTTPYSKKAWCLTKTTVTRINGYNISYDSNTTAINPGDLANFTFRISNLGNGIDKVDLIISSKPSGWYSNLSQSSISLDAYRTVEVYLNQTPLEKILAGTYYTIIKATLQSSSLTLEYRATTTINAIYSINLECSNNETEIDPGKALVYPITIKNYGNVPSNLDLDLVGVPETWNVSLDNYDLNLEPYGSHEGSLIINTSSETITGRYPITIQAHYRDGLMHSSITLTTIINRIFSIELIGLNLTRTLAPGAETIYRISVKNNGNYWETVKLNFSGVPKGWSAALNRTELVLEAFEESEVQLNLSVSQRASVGCYNISVMGAFANRDLSDSHNYSVALVSTTIQQISDFNLNCTDNIHTVNPGALTIFNVLVDTKFNYHETLKLKIESNPSNWVITLSQAELVFEPFESKVISIRVDCPVFELAGIYQFRLVGSLTDKNITATVNFTVIVAQRYGMELLNIWPSVTIQKGKTANLDFKIKNNGNGVDTIDFYCLTTEPKLYVNLLQNSVTLQTNELKNNSLKIGVPANLELEKAKITLRIVSRGNPDLNQTVSIFVGISESPKANSNQLNFADESFVIYIILTCVIIAFAAVCVAVGYSIKSRRSKSNLKNIIAWDKKTERGLTRNPKKGDNVSWDDPKSILPSELLNKLKPKGGL